MAKYIAGAINPHLALNSKGENYRDLNMYAWHAQSPVMVTSGSIEFERKSEDDDIIYFSGTIGTYIPSIVISDGGWYSYPILVKMFVGKTEKHSWKLNENGNSVSSNGPNMTIKDKISLKNNTDDITVHYYCCAGGGGLDTPGCTSDFKCTDVIVFKLPAGKLKYLPYTKPSIDIDSSSTTISKYDKSSATINWSASKNSHSKTYLDINGQRVEEDSGDDKGSLTFKPYDYKVGQASSYDVVVYREGPYNGGTIVSDTKKMYTYTHPTISNTINNSIDTINANSTETFSWTTNSPKWKKEGLETFTTKMYINGEEVKEISGDNIKADLSQIDIPNIGKYVDFDGKKINGQTVEVKIVKSHTDEPDILSVESKGLITVRRIPTKIVQNITYRIRGNDNKVQTSTIPEDAIIDRTKLNGINVQFTYPANLVNEHFGIVNGFRLEIYADDNSKIFTQDYDYTTLKFNETIPINKLRWSAKNKIKIYAYYKHSNEDFNKSDTIDNKIYLGPYIEKSFPTVITRLDKPVINYPVNNSTWINTKYRVLFQLPNDGDFDLYPTRISSNYIYRDIEIRINPGTSNEKVFSWLKNPNIFSIDKASYKAKVAINMSLATGYPTQKSYPIQIRVRKNYGYPDANTYAQDSWSDWSDKITVNVKTYSTVPSSSDIVLFVHEGDYIMASHYKVMFDMLTNMRNTYPTYTMGCQKVNKGDYILASDYDKAFGDINKCYSVVNKWGKYGTTKNSVKFNNGNPIPNFAGTVGEYVTDLENDTHPVGRNYMYIIINRANLLK